MHKGRPVTAGSKIIENFIAPFDATVVAKLEAAGVTILGKTNMGEFGAAGLFEIPGVVNSGRTAGNGQGIDNQAALLHDSGFESGAVAAVADGIARFALCNDYSGAISRQAAANGVCYIRPTYGTVSRYGLIPAAQSMDQIGIVCGKLSDGFQALETISGHDPKDGAMYRGEAAQLRGLQSKSCSNNSELPAQRAGLDYPNSELTIAVPSNIEESDSGAAVIKELTKNFKTVEIELKYCELYTPVMQILCCAEFSNNISRYDGIKFGYRADGYGDLHELYTKTRTEAFGFDVKLAALIGAMVLTQENYARYYDKAMRIRRLIKDSLKFDKYDVFTLPACDLALETLPILSGLPAVTIPYGGGGVTFIANRFREDMLMRLAMEIIL